MTMIQLDVPIGGEDKDICIFFFSNNHFFPFSLVL